MDEPVMIEPAASPLLDEYATYRNLFEAQPTSARRFIEAQGQHLAAAILRNDKRLYFTLPDQVINVAEGGENGRTLSVPAEKRSQEIGGLIHTLTQTGLSKALRQRLTELENSPSKATAMSAELIRYATAYAMVYTTLPSGRTISYSAPEGEEIPSIPTGQDELIESAITASSDAIVEQANDTDGKHGTLQVPFTSEARLFYLPQWVAFGLQGNLLVKSLSEAEEYLSSMEQFLSFLHSAVSLAPFIVADGEYQRKRYGMLGQLVNQGRAMAAYQVGEIIYIIKKRAFNRDLNRGLSLSVPYFDDQRLSLRTHEFVAIPSGRILFVPAFVVKAAREEAGKVAQDTRLSPSTRKYLLNELKSIEQAFEGR